MEFLSTGPPGNSPLLATYIFSLEKCLFQSFAKFLISLFLLLLSFKSSLYTLKFNSLSYMCFVNIFLYLVSCPFILSTVSLKKIFYLLLFWLCESSLLHRLFSSCGEWGLLSSCGAWASHCGGFSCGGAQALGCTGFSIMGAQAQ